MAYAVAIITPSVTPRLYDARGRAWVSARVFNGQILTLRRERLDRIFSQAIRRLPVGRHPR